mmetsp:Transcript_8550/g.20180  ORF Transcript_8550/g.20180 Transcript_8550/m.20180 type:complete len:211 (-) Transcript_8550:649-1281(-)
MPVRPAERGAATRVRGVAPHGRAVLCLRLGPKVHRRAVHRADSGHGLQHRALPALVAAARRGPLRNLEDLLPLRPRQAGQVAARQQARAIRTREAHAVQGAQRLAGAGGRLRALDPGPALHRRRGADALLLPLPDDQPAAQPERRPLYRVRAPVRALLRLLRAAAAGALRAGATHLAGGGALARATRTAAQAGRAQGGAGCQPVERRRGA